MNNTKWVSAIALVLSFAMSASAVSALTLGTNGTLDIDANVGNNFGASASANISGNASTSDQGTNVSGAATTNAAANVGTNSVINLTRDDLATQDATQASVT